MNERFSIEVREHGVLHDLNVYLTPARSNELILIGSVIRQGDSSFDPYTSDGKLLRRKDSASAAVDAVKAWFIGEVHTITPKFRATTSIKEPAR